MGEWSALFVRLFIAGQILVSSAVVLYAMLTLASAIVSLRREVRPRGLDARFRRYAEGGGPLVTVMVPCRNEASVVRSTLRSVATQSYPNIEIIAIDDNSSDGTADQIELAISDSPGADIRLVRRAYPNSNKARALNDALRYARGEIVAFFDADYILDRDCVGWLVARIETTQAGAVQGRVRLAQTRGPINRAVALERLAGFDVRMRAKSRVGLNTQFGGTVGAVRRSTLDKLGGFEVSSLTEDTDLTVRIILAGQRVVFEPCAIGYEQAPPDLRNYVRQKSRWAQGHMRVCLDHWSGVLRSNRLSFKDRFDTLVFLGYYFVHFLPLMVLAFAGVSYAYFGGVRFYSILLVVGLSLPFSEFGAGIVIQRRWREAYFLPVMLFFYILNMAGIYWAMLRLLTGRDDWLKTGRASVARS
ncbi:MAG: glycosyltransferase family 2 protein [Anaerosomatales bacterium]|nr:glycosyltransferase family 2 protein [Anaerosomatales bacterium]